MKVRTACILLLFLGTSVSSIAAASEDRPLTVPSSARGVRRMNVYRKLPPAPPDSSSPSDTNSKKSDKSGDKFTFSAGTTERANEFAISPTNSPTISHSPSISPAPSVSTAPSKKKKVKEKAISPTNSPTISHSPSISLAPSVSAAPSEKKKVKEKKCKQPKVKKEDDEGKRALRGNDAANFYRYTRQKGNSADKMRQRILPEDEDYEYVTCAPTTSPSPTSSAAPSSSSQPTAPPSTSNAPSTSAAPSTAAPSTQPSSSPVSDQSEGTRFGGPPLTTKPTESGYESFTRPTESSATTSSTDPPISSTTDIDTIKDRLIPTPPPDPNSVLSPGCDRIKEGKVYKTRLTATILYDYEAKLDLRKVTNVDQTISDLGGKMQNHLAHKLVNCNTDGRRMQEFLAQSDVLGVEVIQTSLQRRGRVLQTDGVGPPGEPDKISETCGVLNNVKPGEKCVYVEGSMVLYLREDSPASSKAESSTAALKELEDSFGAFEDVDNGIIDLHYLHGDMEGAGMAGGPGAGGGVVDGNPSGDDKGGLMANAVSVQNNDDGGIKPIGGVLLGASVLGIVLVALLLLRKKKKSDVEVLETFEDGESVSVFTKNTGLLKDNNSWSDDLTEGTSDQESMAGWRKGRPGHVLGEDDSVYSSNNLTPRGIHDSKSGSIINELRQTEASHSHTAPNQSTLASPRNGVDVHVCNSAMCEMCRREKKSDPTFVSAEDIMNSFTNGSFTDRPYATEDTVEF